MKKETQVEKSRLHYAQPNRGLLSELPEEVMSDRWLRVKCDPVWRCGTNNFEREGSVLDWRKALPIGNGDIGAAVHGYPDNYTFHIAKNDVWWDNVEGMDPYPDMGLAELRERVAAGDPGVKHDIRCSTVKGHKADPLPTSCARLSLQLCRAGVFYNVKEYLNMMNATASTEFCVSQNGVDGGAFWIQSIVSRLEEVMVVRMRPPHSLGLMSFELNRDPMEGGGTSRRFSGLSQAEFDAKYEPKAETANGLGWFTMQLSGGDSYTVMVASDSPALKLTALDGGIRGRGRPDGTVSLFVTVVSSHDANDTVAEARRRMERALAIGADTIWGEHGAWWSRFWRRSWVSLPPGQSERSWYWGVYKAASSRRPGKVCPAYGAPWRAGNFLNWGSYTLNYEEVKYNQGMLSTNHGELLEPWIAVVKRGVERLRRTTERFYKLPGVCFPHAITWKGEPVFSGGIYNSTAMSVNTTGEAVKCAWDYFDFTGDVDFLRRVGYPLLKEAALFYRAYLQEEANGKLVIFPSRYNEHDSWCESMDDFMRNSVTDLAMFRFVLTRAAQAARVLGIDETLAADWADAETRLPEYATWPDGTVKPSEDWVESGSRPFAPHPDLFELWPVSATGEVDAWHGPEARRAAFMATYKRWLGHGPLTTWDRCFPFIAAARMGDREYAAKILTHLQTIPEAGNINRGDPPDAGDQDGHCPFVVDAGSAFPAEVVTEFLLQSHGGDIRLFPAAPLTGHYAFHSLRARGAFLVSSEFRDGQVPYALIQSLRGNLCRVANPFGATAVRVRDLDTGRVMLEQNVAADAVIEFTPEVAHTVVLERADCPLEQVSVVQLK